MGYAKLLNCKLFPELFEAKILCTNPFPKRKETLFEEETQQTEQTLVSPEVRLSQRVTAKSRDCFCTFFPRAATF